MFFRWTKTPSSSLEWKDIVIIIWRSFLFQIFNFIIIFFNFFFKICNYIQPLLHFSFFKLLSQILQIIRRLFIWVITFITTSVIIRCLRTIFQIHFHRLHTIYIFCNPMLLHITNKINFVFLQSFMSGSLYWRTTFKVFLLYILMRFRLILLFYLLFF